LEARKSFPTTRLQTFIIIFLYFLGHKQLWILFKKLTRMLGNSFICHHRVKLPTLPIRSSYLPNILLLVRRSTVKDLAESWRTPSTPGGHLHDCCHGVFAAHIPHSSHLQSFSARLAYMKKVHVHLPDLKCFSIIDVREYIDAHWRGLLALFWLNS
jgi:hypothetical protein